jgi:hypothetical protein
MAEIREWTVQSNSFRPDYTIHGETLAEAIRNGFGRLCHDALPRAGGWHAVRGEAEWRSGILRGRGGIEVLIEARRKAGEGASTFPVWIMAGPGDMKGAIVVDAQPHRVYV